MSSPAPPRNDSITELIDIGRRVIAAMRADNNGYASYMAQVVDLIEAGRLSAARRRYSAIPKAGMGGMLDSIDPISYQLLPRFMQLLDGD